MYTERAGKAHWTFANSGEAYRYCFTKALEALANAQQCSIGRTSELLASGMVECGLENFDDRFNDICNHPVVPLIIGESKKFPHIADNFRSLLQNREQILKTMKMNLSGVVDLPNVVLHHDLGSFNFYTDEANDSLRILDWGMSTIGHPMMEGSITYFDLSFRPAYFRAWARWCKDKVSWETMRGCRELLTDYSCMAQLLHVLNMMRDFEVDSVDFEDECGSTHSLLNAMTRHASHYQRSGTFDTFWVSAINHLIVFQTVSFCCG